MPPQTTKEILKKVRQIELRTRRQVEESLAGQYQSIFKGRGMNFEEVREYVAGDEIRSIDWNVTARTGRPFIKKFSEERELTILLVIDISASQFFGSGHQTKREYAAEVASALAFSALRNNDKVGLLLFTDRVELYIPPAKGKTHILRVIREILFFEPKGYATEIIGPLDFLSHVVRHRGILFLISDFYLSQSTSFSPMDQLRTKLKSMRRRFDLITLLISDPREKILPPLGLLTLQDVETGEQLEINTQSSSLREKFQKASHERIVTIRRLVRSAGVDFLELSVDQPYLPILLGFFKARERRGR